MIYLGPEAFPDVEFRRQPWLSCLSDVSSRVGVHDSLFDDAVDLPQRPTWLPRMRPIIDNARQFVASNLGLGLLLVVASEAFFSSVNIFVKQLSVIDDQILTFEVSGQGFLLVLEAFGNMF